MKTNRPLRSIAAFGELVFDHIFISSPDVETRYSHSRGGGSLWNLLANLASWDVPVQAFAACGDDVFGKAAAQELANLGVHTEGIFSIPRKRTRLIFEKLSLTSDASEIPFHKFTDVCFVCGRSIERHHRADADDIPRDAIMNMEDLALICLDRLTSRRLDLVLEAREKGILSLLVLGRVGDLRYMPVVSIARRLSEFDIVSMPEAVCKSVEKRLRLGSIGEIIREIGRPSLICVTKAEKGLTLHVGQDGREPATLNIPGVRPVNYVDTAGAGDYFLAHFLHQLWSNGLLYARSKRCFLDHRTTEKAAQEALAGIEACLSSLGARGHLKRPRLMRDQHGYLKWRETDLAQIQEDLGSADTCPFCLQGKGAEKRRCSPRMSQSRRNVSSLLQKTLFVIEQTKAVEQCQNLMKEMKGKTAYVVGTGGSFPSAVFIGTLMSREAHVFAQALRPFDYIRQAVRSECLVVVSHSGRTWDCGQAIKHAYRLGVRQVVLVTGSTKPTLKSLLRSKSQIVSYGWKSEERGFVSIAATVCPCALWVAAASTPMTILRMTNRLAEKTNGLTSALDLFRGFSGGDAPPAIVEVLGGGWAWPAMLDIESKFAEGKLGTVRLHESKDFSHGRFISVLHPGQGQPRILITVGRPTEYEKVLRTILHRAGNLVSIESKSSGMFGALEALIEVQFLIQRIAEDRGIDISRPGIRDYKDGLRLYHWRKPLED